MPYSLTINGSPYPLPLQSERMWAEQVNAFFDALSKHLLQKSGGVFTLGSEVDFGTGFGAAIKYIKSKSSSNLSQRGFVMLDKGDYIGWRNGSNIADILGGINSSDRFVIGSPTAFSAIASTDLFTSVGRVPLVGEALQLVSFTGTGLTLGGIYYATNVSGMTFQLYGTPGGPVLADVTGDGSGVFIILDPVVTTGSVDVMRNKTLMDLSYDSETASISSGVITPVIGKAVQRLTAGAGDIQMIASPSSGRVLILVNETGSDKLIKNDLGATAENRIVTGSGSDLTLKNQAAVTLIYNSGLSRWVVSGGSGGGGLAPSGVSANFTAAAGNNYLTDTSAGAITATLPAGSTGATIRFVDASESWLTYNLTITPASGEKIDQLAIDESLVCDVVRGWVELNWTGSKWAFSSFASTAAGEASGTNAGIVSTGTQSFAGDKTFLGSITPSGGIVGKSDGVAVGAGKVGHEISSTLARGSAASLTSGTHFQVGSVQVTLTPGFWMLTGVLGYVGTATALTQWRCGYNTTNTALTEAEYNAGFATVGAGSNNCNNQDLLLPLPTRILNISSTTTYYLMGFSSFTGGTVSAYGQIRAIRMPA